MDYKLIDNTPDVAKRMLEEINQAENSIKIQFMTFEADEIGTKFFNALISKVKEGVEVNLKIDSFTNLIISDNSVIFPNPIKAISVWREWFRTNMKIKEFIKAGGKFERTNKFNVLKPWQLRFHNHRKILIIDEKIAFIGGFNISDHNYSWHDTCVEIRKKSVIEKIDDIFDDEFNDESVVGTGRDLSDYGIDSDTNVGTDHGLSSSEKIFLNNNSIMLKLKHLIENAEKRILIESAYFRDEDFLRLIDKKRHSGVEVKIIKPKKSNKRAHQIKTMNQAKKFPELFKFREKPSEMTHAKIALIDDVCIFGSSNFEWTDLKEISLFVSDVNLAKQFESYFD